MYVYIYIYIYIISLTGDEQRRGERRRGPLHQDSAPAKRVLIYIYIYVNGI